MGRKKRLRKRSVIAQPRYSEKTRRVINQKGAFGKPKR